jgi:glycosyltransferase involved in cell wall biosynthesis
MIIGYSASLWDDGRSGIGTYIAESLRVLLTRAEPRVIPIAYGGRLAPTGSPALEAPPPKGLSRRIRPLYDIWWHRTRLPILARAQRFDLVHVPSIRRLPGKTACPSVVTVHDLGPLRVAKKYGWLRGAYHQQIVPRWLKSIDHFVTPSQFTKHDLQKYYGLDERLVTVVPNGVNHEMFKPGDREESLKFVSERYGITPPYFVYISRLEYPAKNHVRLLRAFEQFKERQHAPHQLVLVGTDWRGHEVIRRHAAPLENRGWVKLTGFVPVEGLPHFLRGATALVYPSLFEGFGLPVVEAMACGTPVACSETSSLGEIAKGNALLFDPENEDQIAQSLAKLAGDEACRNQLSRQGLAHAANYRWSRCVEDTIAVWKKTIESA